MWLNRSFLLLLAVCVPSAVLAQAAPGFTPPGANIAMGKRYTLEPAPNYDLCTDEGDRVQFTDGKCAPTDRPSSLWGFTECVGWANVRHVVITFDLERDTPVAGMMLSTEAGHAGVGWPAAVLVAVSSDGEHFQIVGDLIGLSAKHGLPPASGRFKFVTDGLRTHGRYVRLIILPAGAFTFTDEIEIYGGQDEWTGQPVAGEPLSNADEYLAANRVPLAVRTWVARDAARARAELASSTATEPARARVGAALDKAEQDNQTLIAPPGAGFRAVYPLNGAHKAVLAAMGALRAAEGRPMLEVWKNNRWEPMPLHSRPASGQGTEVALQVRMIRNERRGEVVNIANNSPEAVVATVEVEGLPGGPVPDYLSLREVRYVAMPSGRWDANALPNAAAKDGRWQVTLPAGVSQQLWMAFHPGPDFPPGRHGGSVVIRWGNDQQRRIPLTLIVEPPTYPAEHTLAFGMWDYTDGDGAYGLTPNNLSAAVAHMQSYGYNTPWAHPNTYPRPGDNAFGADDELVGTPDFTRFDAWVMKWPNAKYYALFGNVGTGFADVALGTEKFDRRLGVWLRAWAKHVKELGKDPQQFILLFVDEPGGGKADEQQRGWARAAKQANSGFKVFIDPTHYEPHKTGLREMFETADIICPEATRYWGRGQAVWDFYEQLRAGGRQLWLYQCSGGPSSVDPIAYYRAQQWMLWPMQGIGTLFWAYGDVGGAPGGSWNTLGASGEVFSPAYIDSDSVTDGKHWLAIIEGIQDYEYLRMLRDRIVASEKAGRQSPALDRARSLLGTLPEEAIRAATQGDRDAFDSARLKVLDALLAIQ